MLGTALLGACSTPVAPPVADAVALPGQWSTPGPTLPSTHITRDWWRSLGSAELDGLILTAQAQSLDVAAAAARVRQAEAGARSVGAALLPGVSATVDASRQGRLGHAGGGGTAAGSTYAAGFSTRYEVDFWGRNQATHDSALAQARASAFDRDTVQLTVTAAVAEAWLQLVGGRERLAIAGLNLRSAEQVLAVVESRTRAGAATALEQAQQQGLVATQHQAIAALRQQVQGGETVLALLLGQTVPPPLQAGTLAPLQLPATGPGIPADLLVRRPDVARAEARLAAAHADVRAARAALLPRIELGAGVGVAGARLGSVLDHPLYTLAAGLTAPVFDAGRLAAGVDLAQARNDELLAHYRATVVAAVGEVEVALQAVAGTDAQIAAQARVLAHAQQAATLAQARYRAGAESLLILLDAQRTLYAAQDTAVQLRQARLAASVALYRALGGGWHPTAQATSPVAGQP